MSCYPYHMSHSRPLDDVHPGPFCDTCNDPLDACACVRCPACDGGTCRPLDGCDLCFCPALGDDTGRVPYDMADLWDVAGEVDGDAARGDLGELLVANQAARRDVLTLRPRSIFGHGDTCEHGEVRFACVDCTRALDDLTLALAS